MATEPDEERLAYTKAELESRIRQALGGRAAELLNYGERDGPSTSAAGDLRAATRHAGQMVQDYDAFQAHPSRRGLGRSAGTVALGNAGT